MNSNPTGQTKFPLVLKANDPLIKKWLWDFRLPKGEGVVRLIGEGKFLTANESEANNNIIAEQIDIANWKRPPLWQRWWQALRFSYLWFSLLPYLLVIAELNGKNSKLSIVFLLALFCLHTACIFWNDVEDHILGVDSVESSGGSGVIRKLWIPAIHLRIASISLAFAGIAFSFYLLQQLPWQESGGKILVVGLGAAFLGAGYSGWPLRFKYYGLGEVVVFLLCGPVICAATALALTGEIAQEFWWASIAIGTLAALRQLGRDLQLLPQDHKAGSRTLATMLGFSHSLRLLRLLSLLLFALPALLPQMARWVWAAIPLLILVEVQARKITGPLDPELPGLRKKLFLLHFFYGLLLVAGAYFS